jgi:hypothetical protein
MSVRKDSVNVTMSEAPAGSGYSKPSGSIPATYYGALAITLKATPQSTTS